MITKTNNRTLLSMSGTTYDFDFRIDEDSELEVYGIDSDDVATEITTGFTVAFSTTDEEGTVTFDAEPTDYVSILMLRNRPYTQDVDIPIRGGFSEEDIEKALDALAIQIQQLKELVDYSVKQSVTGVAVTVELPTPEDGKALAWDGTSGAMQNLPVDTAGLAEAEASAIAAQAAAEAAQTAAEAAAAAIATKATQAQAEAASADDVFMTPLQVKNAVQKSGAMLLPVGNLPGLQAKAIAITRDIDAADGDVAYTGLGFTPKAIIAFTRRAHGSSNYEVASWGFGSLAADDMAIHKAALVGGVWNASMMGASGNLIFVQHSATQNNFAALKTMDADGFTLTWTKTGAALTTDPVLNVIILALR